MALVNHAKKEINAKLVYYGPPGCGKSAALHYIYSRIKPSLRGDLKNVPAGGDCLLFFDFSPFEMPMADGYRLRLHVYTLTGQVANPATWKMTLKGADGLVIMVNPAPDHILHAQKSVSELREMLSAYGVGLQDLPVVLQLNSSEKAPYSEDASRIALELDLQRLMTCKSSVDSGEGVLDVLTALSRLVLQRVLETENRPAPIGTECSTVNDECDELDEPGESVFRDGNKCTTSKIYSSLNGTDDFPTISVVSHDSTVVDGKTLRIPIDISCGAVSRRLVVSVSVD